jgi:hypothetical protein
MANMKKIIIAAIVLVFSLCYNFCIAGEVDIDLFGFCFHFNKLGAYNEASLKLDKYGKWVFNPGIGLGYDFRNSIKSEGFSPIVQGGIIQNCSVNPFYFGGAGVRYRKFMLGKLFWEANALGTFTYARDWDGERYKFSILPYGNIGIGYDFGNNLVAFLVSYVPQNGSTGVGNDTSMLFLNMEVSF